ncbi:uncharacterized protein LOC119193540, partial [Manduca sexta]
MVNIEPNQSYTKPKQAGPAIHISALPTRQNQGDLPSFSIPLQYNLGTFKKVEDVQIEESEQNQWDGRIMSNFHLMNLKPLVENREDINMTELKYEVKNENRVNYEIANQIETEDILGKETVNEGQTISPDFEIRYQYQNETDKRYREGFESSIMEDGRNDFVCDNDFLCKSNYDKADEKR